MALFYLTPTYSLDGRIADKKFSNRLLFQAPGTPDEDSLYAFGLSYVNLLKPLLADRIEIYSTTISPIAVPGTLKRTRNDHITRYFGDPGSHNLDADQDVALLTVCAQFFKYSTKGAAGEILIRGILSEDELQSNKSSQPENINAAANGRFDAFGVGVLALFRSLGGKGLVMPGPKRLATGEIPSLAAYEASARQVMKVEFDGYTQRDVNKRSRSIEGKTSDLLRSYLNRMLSFYNEALEDADNISANIAAANKDALAEMGHAVFLKFTAAERQKVKSPAYIKTYIK